MKRVLCFLLTLLLVVGLAPVQAMANDSQPYVLVVRMTEDHQDLGTDMIEQAPGSMATIVPPAGYRIVRTEVAGDTSNLVVDANGCFTMPDTSMEVLVILAHTEDSNTPQPPAEELHHIAVNIEGSGTASAPATAASGGNVSVQWEAGTGYELKSITGVGPQGSFEIYSNGFTMPDGDVTVTVTFGPIGDSEDSGECYLAYKYCDLGGSPIGQEHFESVTPGSVYTFAPLDNYVINRITDINHNPVAVNENNSVVIPEGGLNVFIWLTQGGGSTPQPAKYRIDLITPEHGAVNIRVNGAAVTEAAEGDSVTVTAEPSAGYELTALTVTHNSETTDIKESKSFTMPGSAVTVTATFSAVDNGGNNNDGDNDGDNNGDNDDPDKFTITAEAGNGIVNILVNEAAVTEAAEGDSVTVTAEPSDGYELTALTVTHNSVTTDIKESKTFTMPAGDVTVTATFEEETPEYSGLTFAYGYDVYRSPTFPKKGGTFRVYNFGKPLNASGSRTDNAGPWALTGVGTYGAIKNNDNLPKRLSGIVSSLAREYGVQADSMPVHVLTHNGEYITHGVLVMHDPSEPVVFFIGSNYTNGAGYLFCNVPQSGEKTYSVPSDVTDQAIPEVPKDISIEHITNPETNSYGADLDMTDETVLKLLLGDDNITEDTVVFMDVKKLDNAPGVEKQAIEAKASSDKLAAFLDIKMFKKVGNRDPEAITNTHGPVTITMTMDAGVIPDNAERVYIIYYHGGVAKTIPAAYNRSTRKLAFQASEFSTYALAYKVQAPAATASAGVLDNVPKTGDNSTLLGWTMLILCSAAILTGVTVIDKKRAR